MTEHSCEMTSNKRYTISHFELSNPLGPGQGNVPALLRRVADAIEELGDIEVHDLILHPRITRPDGEDWPSIVVYYDYKTPTSTPNSEAPE
jgi:hypothetical protein